MILYELNKTGMVEIIEKDGERWNLSDLCNLREALEDMEAGRGMLLDDASEYRLFDTEDREISI